MKIDRLVDHCPRERSRRFCFFLRLCAFELPDKTPYGTGDRPTDERATSVMRLLGLLHKNLSNIIHSKNEFNQNYDIMPYGKSNLG